MDDVAPSLTPALIAYPSSNNSTIELKTHASAIADNVKRRRVTYAVTKHGTVEALIVPVDAGERLLAQPNQDSAWETGQALVAQLSRESGKGARSAVAELERMRR